MRFYIVKERRRFKRLRSYWLARYSKGNGNDLVPADDRVTNISDICEGGVAFTANEYIPPFTPIRMIINLPIRERPIEACGHVAHCTRVSNRDRLYRIGLTFIDIPEEDRSEISSHIDSSLRHRLGKRLISQLH